jgi:glycosyltransferase involved in cell wall biosynthesis
VGDPLRILHTVVNMNRGGAETLIMNLYRNMDRAKIQFDFLTCKEGVFDSEINELGGRVHRIPYVSDVGHFGYTKALNRFFLSHKYKIVHAHLDRMSGLVLRAAKKADIPIRIAHSHNTSSEGGLAAKAYKALVGRLIPSSATHLVACSHAAANWLYAEKARKSMILKNGIECGRFTFSPEIRKQVREELQIAPNQWVVGHVGRFNHQKNHTFLIDIFSQFVKAKPESVLVMAGDGLLRLDIEKKVKDASLESHIRFLGVRNDIHRLLQAFDIFVFPSLHEGLPVTLIEAQGAGLPCLLSDTITKEVDMGIKLVEYSPLNDMDSWLETMLQMANMNHQRNSSAHALSQNGYDIKNTAKSTQDFYLAVSR